MGRNLTNLFISESFEYLIQVSGSDLQTGLGATVTGSLADPINITVASASNAESSSYALTASFALNGGGGTVDTGSLLVTGSISNATLTFTKGNNTTFDLTVNNVISSSHAVNADIAISSSHALNSNTSISASHAIISDSSLSAISSSFASTAISSSHALSADTSISSSHAVQADNALLANTASYVAGANVDGQVSSAAFADTATSASHALVSDTVNDVNVAYTNIDNSFTGNQSFNNITVNGTGSFAYIQSVTGSAKIIGDAFVQVNTDSPQLRYGGIQVVDSGSLVTASLQWDSEKDIWMQQEVDGTTAGLITGVSGSKGIEAFPTVNKLVKGAGTHQITDSSITDNGSLVKIESNTEITGSLGVSAGIVANVTGNLTGNADTATSSSFATVANGLTDGDKTLNNGALTQNFTAPALFNEKQFVNVTGASIAGKPYNRVAFGFSDFSNAGFGFEDYFGIEYFDSFGYNFGAEFNLNGRRAAMSVSPSASLANQGCLIEARDNNNGTGTTNILGGTVNIGYSTGNNNIRGVTNFSGSSGFPVSVDGTMNTRRIHFDKNPFNDDPSDNLGAIRLDGNNKQFYGTLYNNDFQLTSQSAWVLINDTTASFNAVEFYADFGGTSAEFEIRNDNGVRSAKLHTDTFSVSGSTTFHSPITGSISTAISASTATSASYILGSNVDGAVANATSASYALSSSIAEEVENYNTASGSIGFWQGSQTEYDLISGSASNDIIYFVV